MDTDMNLSKQLNGIILQITTNPDEIQLLTSVCSDFSQLNENLNLNPIVDIFLSKLEVVLNEIIMSVEIIVSLNKKKYSTKKLQSDLLKNELDILFQNINFIPAIKSTIYPRLYTDVFFAYINYFDDAYLMVQKPGSILEFIFTMSKLPRLKTDFDNWKLFFKKMYENYPGVQIYLKGGSVIGLLLLQNSINSLELQLIRDFDFILEDVRCCTDLFYYEFGAEFNIVLNGKKSENGKKNQGGNTPLHVMRSIHPIRLPDTNDYLFEMAICAKDIGLELPMTSMKLPITPDNYIGFFSLIEKIHINSIDQSNLDFLNCIHFDIPKCDINGMFDVDHIDCKLSDSIKNIVNKITSDKNCQQCLYYLTINPTNLSRLEWKNIPKSNKIKLFYGKSVLPWLLNNDLILDLTDKFIYELALVVNTIYLIYKSDIDNMIEEINNLENNSAVIDCNYDLTGIGGSSTDVIAFLRNQNTNMCISKSPRISKLLSKKNLVQSDIETMIDIVYEIGLKCDKYNVTYIPEQIESGTHYAQLKNSIKKQMYEVRKKLTEVYCLMFGTLVEIFEGMNMIRWKDNIELYRSLSNPSAINCITNIFKFAPEIKIKLNDGSNIITDSQNLSKNSIWLLFMELDRVK